MVKIRDFLIGLAIGLIIYFFVTMKAADYHGKYLGMKDINADLKDEIKWYKTHCECTDTIGILKPGDAGYRARIQ
jgi:gas vesicle protein